MDPKQQALRNKQRERQQRGQDFQEEIRRSWRLVPNLWTLHLREISSTTPADRVVIGQEVNVLTELKRTKKQKFELDFLRPNQIKGLVDFDQVVDRNYGLVFVSFHNPGRNIDSAYAFRLITALRYLKEKGRLHITLEEFEDQAIPSIPLPRLEAAEPTYDLKGVLNCYKYL
jgi:hypothetical protein